MKKTANQQKVWKALDAIEGVTNNKNSQLIKDHFKEVVNWVY